MKSISLILVILNCFITVSCQKRSQNEDEKIHIYVSKQMFPLRVAITDFYNEHHRIPKSEEELHQLKSWTPQCQLPSGDAKAWSFNTQAKTSDDWLIAAPFQTGTSEAKGFWVITTNCSIQFWPSKKMNAANGRIEAANGEHLPATTK